MRACSERATLTTAALSLFALLATGQAAHADSAPPGKGPRTSSLSWVRLPGADSCVSTQDLARDVEARLHRSVFVSPSDADVSVEGRIEPKPKGGWHATIAIRDDRGALLGNRNLDNPATSCGEMREELAFVIAVMIDPDAALTPRPAPAPARAPDPPRWRLDAGTSVAGAAGLLPHVSLGVRVDALLTPPKLIPLEGFGVVWPHDSLGSASIWLALVGGGLCPLRYLGSRVLLYGCASGIAGMMSSSGPASTVPVGITPVLGAELEGRLSLRLGGPFVARLGVALVVPIIYPAGGTMADPYKLSPVAGTADLGLGVVF
jgi:hypothetical protein